MASFKAPLCETCIFLDKESLPEAIGDRAKCSKYKKRIPDKIFYEGKDCEFYKTKRVKRGN